MAVGKEYVGVATTDDIAPGHMLRIEIHGVWIVIANLDNEYFALADTCTHEEASLFKGVLKDGCIRCPLHGSKFDVKTGQPLEEPAEEPVNIYPVEVEAGIVYVGPAE